MDLVQQLGAALGLGLLSGVRLYLTVLALGTAIRMHWLQIADSSYAGLAILADWRVMAFAGGACAIEFIADKVPWVDSAWDSIHTFIRPIGAVVLGANAFSTADPALRAMLMILCGGVALTGHSAKAATRLAVNHSPEPFSNLALSLAGDAMVPLAAWFTFRYPAATLAIVSVFVLAVWWLSPRIFRAMRVQYAAAGSSLSRWFSSPAAVDLRAARAALPPNCPPEFADHLQPIPEQILEALRKRGFETMDAGVRCAAASGASGVRNSIGFLTSSTDRSRLLFATRRWFRFRVIEIPFDSTARMTWRRRWISDSFSIDLRDGRKRLEFDVFRTASPSRQATQQQATA